MKKRIICLILILIVAVGGGIGAYILNEANKGPAEIEESEAKYKTTLKEAPTDGSLPEEYSVYDNIAFAMWKIENTNEFKTITTGTSEASVATIKIYNTRTVKNGKAIVSTVSSGMVSSGKQKYFLDNKVLLRDASKINGFDTVWKAEQPECISNKAYIKRYGWLPYQCTGYIICEDTILETSELIINGDGTYNIKLVLNPDSDYAPFWYRREVLTNAGSTMEPEFRSIEIEYKLDTQWRILESRIQEEYKVKSMGVEAVSKTDCTEIFSYENVEMDENEYNFFKQYESLTPADGEDNPTVEDDVLTMITSSLQNADGSNKNLNLTIQTGSNEISGLVSLNISDLKNVKVKAQLDSLYLEYSDSLYISLGGLKIKATMDSLMDAISTLTGGSSEQSSGGLSLDASQIINDLNAAEVIRSEDGNDIQIHAKLNIMGIELPLNFHFSKTEGTYSILSASTKLVLDGTELNVELTESSQIIPEVDKTQFYEFTDIKFIVDELANILTCKKATANIVLSYENLEVIAEVKVDFVKNIQIDCSLKIKYKTLEENINLAYINETLYVNYESIYLKITQADLMTMLKKYANIDLSSNIAIDLNGVISTILAIDYDELLKDISISEDNFAMTIGLSQFAEKMADLQLSFKKDNGIVISAVYEKLSASINLSADISEEIKVEDSLYQNLGYLDYVIDNVLAIYTDKKVEINLAGQYQGIDLGLNGQVDFTSNVKLNVNINLIKNENNQNIALTYINDMIYLNLSGIKFKIQTATLTDLMKKAGVDISSSNMNIDTILDILLTINYKELIQKLTIFENSASITLGLSQFISGMEDITLELQNNENGLGISTNLLNLKGRISSNSNIDITIDDTDYQSVEKLSYIFDEIFAITDSKTLGVEFSGSKDKLSLQGIAKVDFTEGIKACVDIQVSYDGIELPLVIHYLDSFTQNNQTLNNVILINFRNIYAYITVDDLKAFIPDSALNPNDFNLGDLLTSILSVDFARLIEGIVLEDENTLIDINLSQFNLDLQNFLDTTKTISLAISKLDRGLNLSIPQLFNLDIKLYDFYDGKIQGDNTKNYINLYSLVDYAMVLVNLIGKESITISLDGSINLGGFIDPNGKTLEAKLANSKIDLVLINGKYQVEGAISLICADVQVDVSFKLIDHDLYLSLGGICIKLDVTNLKNLIQEISNMFSKNVTETTTVEGNGNQKINDLLDSILLIDESSISLSLGSFLTQLPKLTILLSKLASDSIRFDISDKDSENSLVNLSITATKSDKHEIGNLPVDYITEDDILTICSYVKDILNLIESKSFTILLGNKDMPLEIIQDKKIVYKIYGSLTIDIDSTNKLNCKLVLRIEEYNGKAMISTHDLTLILKDGMLYGIYGNSDNASEVLRVKTGIDNILGMIATIVKVSGLDLSFIEKYININEYLNPELNYVDFTQLQNLMKSLLNLTTKNDSVQSILNVSDLLHSLNVMDNEVMLQLCANKLIPGVPENEYMTIRISKNTSDSLPVISLDRMYTSYESMDKHAAIRNLSIALSSSSVIEAPESTEGYYDINELGDLVDGILTTATFTDFHIQGTIQLKAISIINVNVPVDIYIKVDETGNFKVYAHLNMNEIGLGSLLVSKKHIYIVYDSGYVYINRVDNKASNSKKIKITYETFLSDLTYYLMDFAMGMPDNIMQLINQDNSNNDFSINASKALTEYGYSEDLNKRTKTFNFGLNMAELTGNTDLGILKAAIELSPVVVSQKDDVIYEAYALSAIKNFNFNVVNVIDISCSSLTISNITETNGYRYFDSISLENQDLYTYVDQYINSNFYLSTGEEMMIDTIYDVNGNVVGKCSHSVFFNQGEGTDLDGNELSTITIKDEAGKSFAIPEPSMYRLYQNRQYYFDGWYLDKEFTKPLTTEDAVIQTKNMHVFAKWTEMYYFTVIDANGSGLKEAKKAGENTSVYQVDSSKGEFIGFYNFDTDELITTDIKLSSLQMTNADLTIYAKWKDMTYLIVDNESKYALTNAEDNTPVSGLLNEKYQIYFNGRYYTYYAEAITSKLLLTKYADCIVSTSEGMNTTNYIYIETYNSIRNGYTTVELDFEYDLFVDEAGNRLYTAIAHPTEEALKANELPYGIYSTYEINAWVDEAGKYYSMQEESYISGRLTAYVSTNRNYFNYQGTEITGYNSTYSDQTANVSTLITPRYNMNYEVVTSIGSGAFERNNALQIIVLSEGIEELKTNAFKNCGSLQKVYFADTVTKVATDAFYMAIDGNNYEANRDIAANIRFYISAGSSLDKSNWLSCKWNSTSKYYGKKYSVLGKGDFTSAFQERANSLLHIVKDLI